MVRSMILSEVSAIASTIDVLDGADGGVCPLPDGHDDIPPEIEGRVVGELAELRKMLCNRDLDVDGFMECGGALLRVAFLMGRKFGQLEEQAGAGRVAAALGGLRVV